MDGDGPDNAPGTTLYESGRLVAQEGWNTNTLRDLQLAYMWSDTFYLFYLQVDDWPDAAELNHDAARTDSVQYWKYSSGAYRPDSLDADWMIRCSLNLAPVPSSGSMPARSMSVNRMMNSCCGRPE